MRLAQRRTFRPIPISAHAVLRIRSQIRQIRASNIVAVIDGADPEGRREAVVFTAHYDHLGVGQPLNGDSIYNGAEDNASGVAALLATAAAFALAGPPPRRSVLFVATTAQESGFLGAEAYAAQPIIPLELTAAVINIDRINLRGVTRDAAALGAERSTLQGYFERAAAAEGLVPAPDPNPEGGYFYRSDHLPFIGKLRVKSAAYPRYSTPALSSGTTSNTMGACSKCASCCDSGGSSLERMSSRRGTRAPSSDRPGSACGSGGFAARAAELANQWAYPTGPICGNEVSSRPIFVTRPS